MGLKMSQYKCEYFLIEELVDKSTLRTLGEDKCWRLFPEQFLICLDRLRSCLGKPIKVNDWYGGGQYQYSGYRPKTCSIGARLSAHKQGQAFDIKVQGMTPMAVYEYLLTHQAMFPEITEMEDISSTPSWIHISCRPTNKKGLKIIKP